MSVITSRVLGWELGRGVLRAESQDEGVEGLIAADMDDVDAIVETHGTCRHSYITRQPSWRWRTAGLILTKGP